jgi:hypothetical protein
MKSKSAAIVCLVAGMLLQLRATHAASDFTWERVTIGGFFSQGYLHSSGTNFPTANKGGTWDFREMGVNASTTLGAHLRVGAQGFAQRFGALGGDKLILDWAVADYNFRQQLGVRVGRVKYPKGLYGEALDLDAVRPFAFLPTALYSPVLRDFAASFDGAMVYGTIDAGKSSFDYKAFTGDIPISPEKGVAEFFNSSGLYSTATGGVAKLGMDRVSGGQLAWNTPVSGLKIVHSYSRFRNLSGDGPFVAAPVLNLHANVATFFWSTFSAEFSRGNWTFASEWQRTGGPLAYAAQPVVATVNDRVGWDSWYVSAARRLGRKLEVGTYYSTLWSRFSTSPRSAPGNHRTDKVVSLRYDVNDHLLVKLETQFIEGNLQVFNTPRIPNPAATRSDRTTVFAAKTTVSF